MTLKTRQPTKATSWPLILLAGEAKTGKTWAAAEFTGDERIGRCFWLDLGEGCADEYGAVPGANYEIIDHDGTWIDIIGQVEEVREIARQASENGEDPVCLVIDSMTAEWAMLSHWTDTRARRSKSNRARLAEDPDAEIDISSNYWNDANSRHNRLMNILKTFPGVVVMTTLETEKTQFDANGRPKANAPKVARPDAQKRLAADATVWVRLSLDEYPTIVGLRSVKHTIRPGKDKPEPWRDFSLSKLVFDYMGIGEGTRARTMPALNADQVMPDEQVASDEPTPPRPPRGGRPQPTAEELDEIAKASVASILAAGTREATTQQWREANGSPARDVDVSKYLTVVDRETLGMGEQEQIVLVALAERVGRYVAKHGRAVQATAEGAPVEAQTEAAAA